MGGTVWIWFSGTVVQTRGGFSESVCSSARPGSFGQVTVKVSNGSPGPGGGAESKGAREGTASAARLFPRK